MIEPLPITIRRARAKDIKHIADAEREYIDCPWTERQIADEIEKDNTLFFVATSGGEFAGYISAVCVADECEIANIAVMEECRRRGIATELFSALFSAAKDRGARSVFLLVSERNVGAKKLYEKLGFTEIGRRKKYYGSFDALSMRLSFSRV